MSVDALPRKDGRVKKTGGKRKEKPLKLENCFFRNVIEIIDDKMLVFDPKDNGDEFYYKGRLQNRRDLNKRAKRDHRFG